MTRNDVLESPPPIVLIGTHRSGTTWLGSLLGGLPGMSYWIEPRQVWTYGNWNKPDDLLLADDVTPEIRKHICQRFSRFVERNSGQRFCEKTPSNCLRIPFIHEVLPSAKIVLLIRDGRAVFRSTEEIQKRGVDWSRIWERVTETSLKELPAYYDRLGWIYRKISGKRLQFWGVRPPGWADWPDQYSSNQILAMQWARSISIAHEHFEQLPDDRRFLLRYEDLLDDPLQPLQQLCEFAQIAESDQLISVARKTVRPESGLKWKRELSDELLEEIRPIMEPVLKRLGYTW